MTGPLGGQRRCCHYIIGSAEALPILCVSDFCDIIGSAEALPILCVSDFCERERERERDRYFLFFR